MPTIDIDPITRPAADKAMPRYIVLDRIGPDETNPEARFVLVSGYYDGATNSLGYPRFKQEGGMCDERTVRLTDATLQGIMAASDSDVKAYIAAHPEIPFLAIVDDWLCNVALAYYQAKKSQEETPHEPAPDPAEITGNPA